MCCIKAVAMCLQGKGGLYRNLVLFIIWPAITHAFSPKKMGEGSHEQNQNRHTLDTCYKHMCCGLMGKQNLTGVSYTCMFKHTSPG